MFEGLVPTSNHSVENKNLMRIAKSVRCIIFFPQTYFRPVCNIKRLARALAMAAFVSTIMHQLHCLETSRKIRTVVFMSPRLPHFNHALTTYLDILVVLREVSCRDNTVCKLLSLVLLQSVRPARCWLQLGIIATLSRPGR